MQQLCFLLLMLTQHSVTVVNRLYLVIFSSECELPELPPCVIELSSQVNTLQLLCHVMVT